MMNINDLVKSIKNLTNLSELKTISDVANAQYRLIINSDPASVLSTEQKYKVELGHFLNENFSDFQFFSVHAIKWRQILTKKFEKFENKLIIIQIEDCLVYQSYLRSFKEEDRQLVWFVNENEITKELTKVAINNPNKNFLFLTSVEFLDRELQNIPSNFYFASIGGDIFLNNEEYKNISLDFDKDLEIKHSMCFNNYPRPHRVASVLYLIHTKLDRHTKMSFLSQERKMSLDAYNPEMVDASTCLDWIYFKDESLRDDLLEISKSLEDYNFISDQVYRTTNGLHSNLTNFQTKLSKHYKSSIVEIVTETTCFEPTLNLTEKYTNTIYGAVFPILISTQGAVDYLRDIGFDVFDDIVDHSYDSEINPFYRMKMAIDLNRRLIEDKQYAYSKWETCKERFIKNKEFFETKFYDIINQRRKTKLLEIKKQL